MRPQEPCLIILDIETMTQQHPDRPVFGVPHRVDYPNSRPRHAVVVGFGAGGNAIVERVKTEGLQHIEFYSLGRSAGSAGSLDSPDPLVTIRPIGAELQKALNSTDMIFLIAQPADDIGMAPAIGKIGRERKVPVTGILIVEPGRTPLEAPIDENQLRILRSGVEMLVIASDTGYVGKMLAALL